MEKFLLYINACTRKDSRTAQLADALISKMKMPHEELMLYEIDFPERNTQGRYCPGRLYQVLSKSSKRNEKRNKKAAVHH